MLCSLIHGVLCASLALSPVPGGGEGIPPQAPTASERSPREQPDDGWSFSITPYVWLYGVEGGVRIRNASADFDVSFGDILENLDVAVMAHVEAWKGKWGLFVDPQYGRLLTEVGSTDVDVETDLALVDFGAFFRVFERSRAQDRSCRADVSVGGRYIYLRNEIDFAMMSDRDQSADFIDLTVGARYLSDVTERFGFLVGGDIGGFDLGSSSEFAWNLQGLASYRLGPGRVWAGYRWLDIDRDDGGSSGIDFQFSGPVVGYEFRL